MFDTSLYHRAMAEALRHPLLFASISGAHLYGFPSPDSDVDLRGCHVLPARALLGLHPPKPTLNRTWTVDGGEIDLVSHDLSSSSSCSCSRMATTWSSSFRR